MFPADKTYDGIPVLAATCGAYGLPFFPVLSLFLRFFILISAVRQHEHSRAHIYHAEVKQIQPVPGRFEGSRR